MRPELFGVGVPSDRDVSLLGSSLKSDSWCPVRGGQPRPRGPLSECPQPPCRAHLSPALRGGDPPEREVDGPASVPVLGREASGEDGCVRRCQGRLGNGRCGYQVSPGDRKCRGSSPGTRLTGQVQATPPSGALGGRSTSMASLLPLGHLNCRWPPRSRSVKA